MQYESFAFIYDKLMDNVDYGMWINYIENIIKRENVIVKNILELACGTGNLTIPLAQKGYDIVGIDISEEMLDVAKQKCLEEEIDVVFLNQDMRELDFEIYDLDCVLCACDGFNYILEEEELKNIFENVYKLLKEEGIFIFDISSYFKMSNILSNNTFGENREDIAYIWQNYFDEEENIVEMDLAFFIRNGKYFEKFEETHYQRAYNNEEILDILKHTGFNNIKVYKDFTFLQADEESERVFFVCKK
ncbi:class I SAM-dependent DNA methyltransferase [Tepidibacter formicigenes]|jgi:ubiquinone/menaquinone biosynthesis C-methylase UbiE|uniref:Methyltransferase domain-containing protein n=1 Tax=Tepidibacter formicigenes DSM 15518 TaxID=1123349 RepID=A0A1M6MLA8_9FIRM|nr:class I SAM-dependent methyltransferase [Tepidibacter formicigenes]SHJ84160.1 Methyltransferase domain-containing protein [Tepidibacter formicigenes DSM 15518]